VVPDRDKVALLRHGCKDGYVGDFADEDEQIRRPRVDEGDALSDSLGIYDVKPRCPASILEKDDRSTSKPLAAEKIRKNSSGVNW